MQFACPLGATPKLNHTETSVTTSSSFGPGTIMIGPCQAQTFFVAADTTNFNTNTHTQTFVDCIAATPNPVPTLSTWAMIAMVALMIAGALLALRRRPA